MTSSEASAAGCCGRQGVGYISGSQSLVPVVRRQPVGGTRSQMHYYYFIWQKLAGGT